MPIIVNKKGHQLLKFTRVINENQIEAAILPSLEASLVIALCKNKVLLVFDRYKQCWELPGGRIESGEKLRACAIRELFEETGQIGNNLEFFGLAEFLLNDKHSTLAAVYFCNLEITSPFIPNNEIEKITFWDFNSNIGYVDEIDHYLAEFVLQNYH